jgi:hypothetical protein
MTSGLHRKADNFRVGLHVSNVPTAEVSSPLIADDALAGRARRYIGELALEGDRDRRTPS